MERTLSPKQFLEVEGEVFHRLESGEITTDNLNVIICSCTPKTKVKLITLDSDVSDKKVHFWYIKGRYFPLIFSSVLGSEGITLPNEVTFGKVWCKEGEKSFLVEYIASGKHGLIEVSQNGIAHFLSHDLNLDEINIDSTGIYAHTQNDGGLNYIFDSYFGCQLMSSAQKFNKVAGNLIYFSKNELVLDGNHINFDQTINKVEVFQLSSMDRATRDATFVYGSKDIEVFVNAQYVLSISYEDKFEVLKRGLLILRKEGERHVRSEFWCLENFDLIMKDELECENGITVSCERDVNIRQLYTGDNEIYVLDLQQGMKFVNVVRLARNVSCDEFKHYWHKNEEDLWLTGDFIIGFKDNKPSILIVYALSLNRDRVIKPAYTKLTDVSEGISEGSFILSVNHIIMVISKYKDSPLFVTKAERCKKKKILNWGEEEWAYIVEKRQANAIKIFREN